MDEKNEIKTIDEYIAQFPDERQARLFEIREVIRAASPEGTTEKISWGMPTFYFYGNLVHFAAAKAHTGFYPGASGVENFAGRLDGYGTTKGAIQFPYNKPLPKELIADIVKFRAAENLAAKKKK